MYFCVSLYILYILYAYMTLICYIFVYYILYKERFDDDADADIIYIQYHSIINLKP